MKYYYTHLVEIQRYKSFHYIACNQTKQRKPPIRRDNLLIRRSHPIKPNSFLDRILQ